MALGAFNRALYNRRSGGRIISESYDLFAILNLSMDVRARYEASYSCNASIQAHMDLWWGYYDNYVMSETISAAATTTRFFVPDHEFSAKLSAKFNPMLWALGLFADSLDANSVTLEAHISPVRDFFASIDFAIGSEQFKETVMALEDIVMHPGSVLVIDSENYIITLDGANIIDKYDGEWFEFMPRLRELIVSSNTSGHPQVSVLYREHYL